jgi:hypothetical protein
VALERYRVKVFISHRKDDTETALTVLRYLADQGVNGYVDVVDPHIRPSSPDIDLYIQEQLRACTYLLPVVSGSTQGSWWVPFEIGFAAACEVPIATVVLRGAEVPEFLQGWPCLRSISDFERFVGFLTDGKVVARWSGAFLEKSIGGRRVAARDVNESLKRVLSQR